jgi:succinoglycan biosynthesis transport protein ExoP
LPLYELCILCVAKTYWSRLDRVRRADVEQIQELDIKRYLRLILKRRYLFAITAAFIITTVVIYSHFIPPVYEANALVSIDKSFLNNALKNLAGTQSIDDKSAALSTIMTSRVMIVKVLSALGVDMQGMTQEEVEGRIKSTQNMTQLDFSKSSGAVDFFTVSFRDKDPRYARDYVNKVVSMYIETNVGSKREDASDANTFLLDQINRQREKVDKLDAEVAVLKKDENVLLYNKFMELQKKLDDLLLQYTEHHPEVVKARTTIEMLKAKYFNSQNKLAYAETAARRLSSREHELEFSKKIYDELTVAYGKSQLSTRAELQDKEGSFKIVDPAVLHIIPVSPNRVKIILMGIIAGLAGAAGLIVLLDVIDDSIKSVDVIKSLGIPVLAIIPHIQDPHALIKSRRKDICFYTLSALYVVLLGVVIVAERLRLFG